LHKPDIVHAQGADASGYLAVKSGVPAVVTIHGILTACAHLRTDFIGRLRELAQANLTERFVVENAANIIAISPYVSKYYGAKIGGAVFEIPNAVSQSYFDVNWQPQAGRFLFAGRISRGKGLIDLVRAVSEKRMAVQKVIMAGTSRDPEFERQLRSEIETQRLETHFEFLGLLDERALLHQFSLATALILPSYQETAPMVIQQAMAAGLPVIATRVGGIPFMIEHDATGLLFEARDVFALGMHLERIALDAQFARQLSRSSREQALAKFTPETVAKATRAAYVKILSPGC